MKNRFAALLVLCVFAATFPGNFALTASQENVEGPTTETIEIPVPEKFGRLVERHVALMFRQGYFRRFNELDFDHGHLLFRPIMKDSYDSVDELVEDVALILYHTDEAGLRWNAEWKLSPEYRKQRSVAGYPDGNILPAIKIIGRRFKPKLCCYESRGTVQDIEVAGANPALYVAKHNGVVKVRIEDGEGEKFLKLWFFIRPSANGRFRLGKTAYDAYFRFQ